MNDEQFTASIIWIAIILTLIELILEPIIMLILYFKYR